MTLHAQLKEEMTNAINAFETNEKKLDKETSLIILELRRVVEISPSALQLSRKIGWRIEKMPSHSFLYRIFYNDLRHSLQKIIDNQTYKFKNLLIEENLSIIDENRKLRDDIRILQATIDISKTLDIDKINEKIKKLEQKLEEQQKSNEILQMENQLLKNEVKFFKIENQQLKQEVEVAKEKESTISQHYLKKLDEIRALKEEVGQLKRHISAVTNTRMASGKQPEEDMQEFVTISPKLETDNPYKYFYHN